MFFRSHYAAYLALSLVLFCQKTIANEMPPVAIESTTVTQETLYNKVKAQGEIKAFKSVVLQSDIAGKVVSLNLQEGKPAKAEQIIVLLDDSIYKAQLKQATAKHEHSKITYERLKKLLDRGTGSASDVEEALASLQFDEASVELAAANLSKTKVKAPFAGILGLKDVDVGDYINPGQKLVELVDISSVLVDFYLPEKFLPLLKEGLQVRLLVDALKNQLFEGEIFAISPTLDPQLRAIHVRAVFKNKDMQLKPGLFSRLNIIFETFENALVLPEETIMYKDNKFYVYKIIDQKAKFTEVKLGVKENGHVQIVEGVEKDDKVVLSGQIKLFDGASVIEP